MRKSSQLIVNPLFAISQIAVLASNNCFRNKFVVANVSLNGLTRGPKTFLIKINPSKKVTRKVKTVRYLSIIKLIARTFIYLISNFSQVFFALNGERRPTIQIRLRLAFASLFNLVICTVNCTTKTDEIQREKVFQNLKCTLIFSLTRPLIDRCQIMTDTCEKNLYRNLLHVC